MADCGRGNVVHHVKREGELFRRGYVRGEMSGSHVYTVATDSLAPTGLNHGFVSLNGFVSSKPLQSRRPIYHEVSSYTVWNDCSLYDCRKKAGHGVYVPRLRAISHIHLCTYTAFRRALRVGFDPRNTGTRASHTQSDPAISCTRQLQPVSFTYLSTWQIDRYSICQRKYHTLLRYINKTSGNLKENVTARKSALRGVSSIYTRSRNWNFVKIINNTIYKAP